jgi:thioredoxin 1
MSFGRGSRLVRIMAIIVAGLTLAIVTGCQQQMPNATYSATGTPRLVELGTAVCIPCALMRPGLDELKREYAGRLDVEVIDTLLTPDAKAQYSAPFCATQIYISTSGKELFRHVGFSSKADILAKWSELGVNLEAPIPAGGPAASGKTVRPKASGN